MGLFNFRKNKSNDKQPPAKANVNKIDMKSLLSEDEIRLLITDLNTVAGKVQGDGKSVINATTEMITGSGVIPVQCLDLCIAAVQDTLGTFSAFGLAPAGNTALLEKLEKCKKGE